MKEISNPLFGFILGFILGIAPIGIFWYVTGHDTGVKETEKIAIEMGCGKYNTITAEYEWINIKDK